MQISFRGFGVANELSLWQVGLCTLLLALMMMMMDDDDDDD